MSGRIQGSAVFIRRYSHFFGDLKVLHARRLGKEARELGNLDSVSFVKGRA